MIDISILYKIVVKDLIKFWMKKLDTANWEVRQDIANTAYFRGQMMMECMYLALEKI